MKGIDQYCQRQRCKHVESEQFLARFRVARVCQRQLGFLVSNLSNRQTDGQTDRDIRSSIDTCPYYTTAFDVVQMKPRRSEGIVLYSRTTHNPSNWFVVELAGGDVRYTCMTSPGQQVRTLRVALSAHSSWHDVAVRRLDAAAGTHFLQVGNESVTLAFGDASVPRPLPMVAPPAGTNRTERSASFSGDDFITTSNSASELYIGGLPRPLFDRLPPEVTSRDGFSGCLASINLNGDTRTLRSRGIRLPDEFYDDVIEGCEGQRQRFNYQFIGYRNEIFSGCLYFYAYF